MSLVEVFNEDGNPTGQIVSQQECLERGFFKRCSWIFLLHKEKGILFQMRSKHKKLLPSHWHVSVSGHLDIGETPVEAAIREAKEELGISIIEDDLKYQGIFTEKVPLTDNRSTNDILYIYFVDWSDKGDNFSLSPEEVESTQWFSLEELERKFSGEWPENFVPYRRIFQSMVSLARDFIR